MTNLQPPLNVPDRRRSTRLFGCMVLASSILLAACSGAATGSTSSVVPAASASPAPSSAPAATASPATSSSGSPASSSASSKVSANTASREQLIAALTAAGVPNPDVWTKEILEYRPYDASDPTLQHLQDQLAKYNPDPATLRGILSVLTP